MLQDVRLLFSIARDVHKARGGRVPIKKFIISNNQDSTRRGWHWVSCVYEIKRKSSGALQIRGRGPLAVGLSGVMDLELEGSGGAPSQAALNGLCSLGDSCHGGVHNRNVLYRTGESGRLVHQCWHIKSSHRHHAQHKQCSFGLRCGLISARSCSLDWGLGKARSINRNC